MQLNIYKEVQMNKGKFIIVEGPDFCGKTTQINLLDESELRNYTYFLITREPGSFLPNSHNECEEIRKYVLSNNLSAYEEAQFFSDSRYIHTLEIIELLNRGFNILSDRYIISSLAYQGYAQGLGADTIFELNDKTLELLDENDITIECIKFTIDKEEWKRRKSERLSIEDADAIEQKDIHDDILEFFTNDSIFNDYTCGLNINIHEIDATSDVDSIFKKFYSVITEIINY
jgi:dTMP kinase